MPESEKNILDMVDIVLESWKSPQVVEMEDGTQRIERVIDERRAWWQTHHIGTTSLGSFAKERENLGNLFRSASYHMTKNRAEALEKQGLLLCQAYDYSIDAKSSECIRDENNAQLTLLSMLAKAKTERQINVKGELGKNVLSAYLNREQDNASK